MAELFVARASGLEGFQKIVAVKRILPALAGDRDFVEMFLNEARLSAALDHPNLAHVYDIGREGEDYFFAMEYVHGEDVRTFVKAAEHAGGLSLSSALTIVVGILAGLHHAHTRIGFDGKPLNLVHRDVSPTNVLVTFDGMVKVVDFGIAKATATSHVTAEGTRKGKLAYMSPEQCRAESVDLRTDIFAVGVMLFELTTGTRLYRSSNEFAILRVLADGLWDKPAARKPGYPPELQMIVERAMALDPDDRYSSALDLQLDLEAFARSHGLSISNAELGRTMQSLLGPKPFPWEGEAWETDVVREDDGTYVCTADLPDTRKAGPRPATLRVVEDAAIDLAQPVTNTEVALEPSSRTGLVWASLAGVVSVLALGSWWFAASRNDGPQAAPSRSRVESTVPTPTKAPVAASETPAPKPDEAASESGPTEALLPVDTPVTEPESAAREPIVQPEVPPPPSPKARAKKRTEPRRPRPTKKAPPEPIPGPEEKVLFPF